jgi:hypothetical protein
MSDTTEGRVSPGWRSRAAVAALLVALVTGLVWLAATRYIETSRKQTCIANISQLASAMRLYSLDYNDYIFFDKGDAFSRPLARGQAGQTPYLKQILGKYVSSARKRSSRENPASDDPWSCPSDPFAKRDFSCGARWSGTFNYRKAGSGYVAAPHAADRDPGMRALHSLLVHDYGADQMRVDHAFSSYRFVPSFPGEKRPTNVDNVVQRVYEPGRGAYGYWDINPSSAWLFEEDLPFHVGQAGAMYHRQRGRVYGKTWGYRDGHAQFYTIVAPVIGGGGELNDVD